MQFIQRALAALITTASLILLAAPAAGQAAPRHHRIRLPWDYNLWSHVADCESGGWVVLGAAYPDSLGITRVNYEAFGGQPLSPGAVPLRERIQQVRVADRLIAHYGAPIPDQGHCAAW